MIVVVDQKAYARMIAVYKKNKDYQLTGRPAPDTQRNAKKK